MFNPSPLTFPKFAPKRVPILSEPRPPRLSRPTTKSKAALLHHLLTLGGGGVGARAYLFYDEFELGPLYVPPWTGTAGSVPPVISGLLFHHGGNSSRTGPLALFNNGYVYKTFGAEYQELYIQFAVRAAAWDGTGLVLFNLLETVPPTTWCTLGMDSVTGWTLTYNTNGGNINGTWAGILPALNQWYIVKIHIRRDAVAGAAELWINGVLRYSDLAVANDLVGSGFDEIWCGLVQFTIFGAGADNYIDCVYVDPLDISPGDT